MDDRRNALSPTLRTRIVRLLVLGWSPDLIAVEVRCSVSLVYRIRQNLQMYGTPFVPRLRQSGRPNSLSPAALEGLVEYVERYPTAHQKEMRWFLWEEFGVVAHQSTVSRALHKLDITRKKAQRISSRQSAELRTQWLVESRDYLAEQFVFVDESNFNESTGWRRFGWAAVGCAARYHADRTRGRSWSVLPAYTTEGYLPCTGIRQGYFDAEAFYRWISDELLPHCNPYPEPRSVIVMDNASIHCNERVEEVIRQHGCRIRYLPPYSPDYNPIELTFSVLKAWVRKHFEDTWHGGTFRGDFGSFLRHAVEQSRCDRFAQKHFRHSAAGYVFEGDLEALEAQIANELDVELD